MSTLKNSAFPSLPPSINSGGYLSLSVDLSGSPWNTDATHEVFTVTGLVRVRLWVECTEDVTSSGGNSVLTFGHAVAANAFITTTGEDDIDAGELWIDATPTEKAATFASVVFDWVSNGIDIGYEIDTEVTTNGTLVFHVVWEPLNSTGSVSIGAGGAL